MKVRRNWSALVLSPIYRPMQALTMIKSIKNPGARLGGVLRAAGGVAAVLSLTGCLTSPYWNQKFPNHTSSVPLQAYTENKTTQVKFECAKAFHGGLYPDEASVSWAFVANVSPQTQPLLDSVGNKIYGASKSTTLPAACWRKDANQIWYAAVRATQGSGSSLVKFRTFSKTGLECLGREVGKAANWGGWIGKGCTATYSGGTEIRYVIFHATS